MFACQAVYGASLRDNCVSRGTRRVYPIEPTGPAQLRRYWERFCDRALSSNDVAEGRSDVDPLQSAPNVPGWDFVLGFYVEAANQRA